MRIVIAGCGKVGYTLAKHLSEEDNDVLIIDTNIERLEKTFEALDVMVLKGNCLSAEVLTEAGISRADLIISTTSTDEVNILCCLTAKKLGAKYSIARVRDPEYATDMSSFKHDLGLDMVINPEHQTANEVSRLLRFPSAGDIETFMSGRVEMASFSVVAGDFFEKQSLMDVSAKLKLPILICFVERGEEAFIPNGSFVLKKGDIARVIGTPAELTEFYKHTGKYVAKLKNILIIGGGRITYYLTRILAKINMSVKIIELDKKRAKDIEEHLSDLSNHIIIRGDGTDEDLLLSEGINVMDAVICLTDSDEENVIIGLYATQMNIPKVIVKATRINQSLTRNIGLRSIVSPKDITAFQIIRFVRALKNSFSNANIQTMYKLRHAGNDDVEALEFVVNPGSRCVNVPLKDLKIKDGILIGCVTHRSKVIIPKGTSVINTGDTVIIITKNRNIENIDEILSEGFGG